MDRTEAIRLLGIQDGFSVRHLQKVYRRKLFENHPDRFTRSRDKTLAHHRFILIQEAFKTLTQAEDSSIAPKAGTPSANRPPTRFHPPIYDDLGYEHLGADGIISFIFKSLSDICRLAIVFVQIPIIGWAFYWCLNPCFTVIDICTRLTNGLSRFLFRLFWETADEKRLIRLARRRPEVLLIRPALMISLLGTLLFFWLQILITPPHPHCPPKAALQAQLIVITYAIPPAFMILLEVFGALTSFLRHRKLRCQPMPNATSQQGH